MAHADAKTEALQEFIKLILESGGELELGRAVLQLSPQNRQLVSNFGALEFVKRFPQLFSRAKKGKSKTKVMVKLDVPLEFCPQAGELGGCVDRKCMRLHLCPFFIKESCKFGVKCKRSHNYRDEQTQRVLEYFRLGFLNSSGSLLQKILKMIVDETEIQRAASSRSLPDICKFYNKAVCKKGENCPCLHVCEHFVDGDCKFGDDCKREHDFCDLHNQRVLEEYDMDDLSTRRVVQCLKGRERKRTVSDSSDVEMPGNVVRLPESNFPRAASVSSVPDICKFYNKGTCKKGDYCPCLHVCEHFIDGDCKFGLGCKREHDFSNSHNRQVLKKYNLDGISELKVLQHLKGREKKRTISGSSDVERPDKIVPMSAVSTVTHARAKDDSLKDTEICGFYLRGKCNYGNSCIHRHTELPYLWEFAVDDDDKWESFSSDLNTTLENAYCDVKNGSYTLVINGIPYKLQFKDMTAVAILPVGGM